MYSFVFCRKKIVSLGYTVQFQAVSRRLVAALLVHRQRRHLQMALLEYENQIFLDAFQEDGLLVMAKY